MQPRAPKFIRRSAIAATRPTRGRARRKCSRRNPRLNCDSFREAATPDYLFAIIADGGEAIGKKRTMRPFSGELSDAEIVDVIAYILGGE